jgi:hypothetical protein
MPQRIKEREDVPLDLAHITDNRSRIHNYKFQNYYRRNP